MDGVIVAYLVKVSVSLALFYGVYMLCLKGDTFLRLRRFFFLFVIFFSLFFPLISLEIPVVDDQDATMQLPTYWLSEIIISPVVTESDSSGVVLELAPLALCILFIVSVFFVIRLVVQLASVIKLRLGNKVQKMIDFHVVTVEKEDVSPFSFFNWIFINGQSQDTGAIDKILMHEYEHVRQRHSIDILIVEFLCVLFWWNPFAWLLRQEVKANLEYLADQGVLNAGIDLKQYQYALLKVSCDNAGVPLGNNFNVSQLKKRISMMNRERSSLILSFKYLLIIPAAGILLLGNAVQATSSIVDIPIPSEILASATEERDNKVSLALPDVMESDSKPEVLAKPAKGGEKKAVRKPFDRVELMPRFPDGEKGMQTYITNNLKYPASAIEKQVSGRVTVRFVVEEDGSLKDVMVVRGIDPDCDSEAIRVVESMPKWVPGQMKDEKVATSFTLPIYFRLSKA